MTLADKRKVIEVLLCAGREFAPNVWGAGCLTFGKHIARVAVRRHRVVWKWGRNGRYHHAATEAAYRLIETSPTLRREWFGAP